MEAPALRIGGKTYTSDRKSSAVSVASAANSTHSSSSSTQKRGTAAVLSLPYTPFNFEARHPGTCTTSEPRHVLFPLVQCDVYGLETTVREGISCATPFMQAAKAKLQTAFAGTVTGQFRRYFETPLFDRLAKSCIYHFLARFEHDALSKVSCGPNDRPPSSAYQNFDSLHVNITRQ